MGACWLPEAALAPRAVFGRDEGARGVGAVAWPVQRWSKREKGMKMKKGMFDVYQTREGIRRLPLALPITKISFEAQVGGVTVTVQLNGGDAERMRDIQDQVGCALAEVAQGFEDETVMLPVEGVEDVHGVHAENGGLGAAFGSSFDNV